MPYNLRSSSQYRHWGTKWMARPYLDTKNARSSRWIVFSLFFTLGVTLKIKSGWKKGVFIFQRSKNVRSIRTIETIDSSLHYRNCYRCFIFTIDIAALTSRFIDSSMYCYSLMFNMINVSCWVSFLYTCRKYIFQQTLEWANITNSPVQKIITSEFSNIATRQTQVF